MSQKDTLSSVVLEYFESQHWHYEVKRNDNDVFIATFGMNLKSRLSSCRVLVSVSNDDIQSFATCPIKAASEAFPAVIEYITRANFGLKVGKFEFDFRDGEVRYQSILNCSDGTPALRDVERVVDMPFLMLQRYGDGLLKNLMGYGFPEEDIKEVEGPK